MNKMNALLILLCLLLYGCGGFTRHFGDAKIVQGINFAQNAYVISIDNIPIGLKGNYSYKVVGLPDTAMISKIYFYPYHGSSILPNWQKAKITVTIIDAVSSSIIQQATIEPQQRDFATSDEAYFNQFELWKEDSLKNLKLSAYIVNVDVIIPSLSKDDTIELEGFFFSEADFKI